MFSYFSVLHVFSIIIQTAKAIVGHKTFVYYPYEMKTSVGLSLYLYICAGVCLIVSCTLLIMTEYRRAYREGYENNPS